ncbi:MAG: hypothetical protein ACI92E_002204 [Oceanicoccus sp.]|jgi:hypothetical protein
MGGRLFNTRGVVKKLIIYNTLGCHLCEQALDLILPLIDKGDIIEAVDIGDSDDLIELYGIRIPVVVRDDNGSEIGWPFDKSQFLVFLR